MKKINHYTVMGEIELLSGTRIGGSDDVLQIGGVDLTCIKDPVTGRPYIPGSSLKGKMRSSLEKHLGLSSGRGDEPCGCADAQCPVCRLFGPHKNVRHELGPTRIIVRDAPLIGDFRLENKIESTIDRKVGTARHPRTIERVAAGSKFKLEIACQEFDIDEPFKYTDHEEKEVRGADALLEVILHCIDLVEQTGIGSGTGKGYGHVRITLQQQIKAKRQPRRQVISDAPTGSAT